MDALRTLAMKLTVDKNGNDATSANFDPANVVQWGFDMQYADNSPLAEASLFGASSFLAADGKTAQIPTRSRPARSGTTTASGRTTSSRARNQINSDLLDKGNEFESGNLAMNESTAGSPAASTRPRRPSPRSSSSASRSRRPYNGTITAKLHADTFSLLKSTEGPGRGLQGHDGLVGSSELLTLYGAFPADPSKQDAFFKSIDANFPGVKLDWSVPQAMLAYPDIPNHQSWVPNYAKAKAAWQAFQNKYRTTAGVDIDAELATLKTTLQGIFDEVAAP